MIDTVSLACARFIYALLSALPHRFNVTLFSTIFKILFFVVPRLKSATMRNLEIAFPESDIEWRRSIVQQNTVEMGRLAADAVRLPSLSEEWVREHVSCPMLERYLEVLSKQNGKGILIATGHLGSFELLGHAIGLMGHPLAAVARNFRSPRFNTWWTALRESRGNRIIGRKGAFKEITGTITSGMSVAVLFDQNVTKNHAVFVDWFGRAAATTKSLGLAALRCEVPIFVASIRYVGDDKYVIDAVECDFAGVYHDQDASTDEKVVKITEVISAAYTEMIRSFPEGWFWMHRRWKTRPESEEESVYQ